MGFGAACAMALLHTFGWEGMDWKIARDWRTPEWGRERTSGAVGFRGQLYCVGFRARGREFVKGLTCAGVSSRDKPLVCWYY